MEFLDISLRILFLPQKTQTEKSIQKNPLNKKRHGRMNYKDTKPYMSAFLSIDLLTEFAAFCLTDFRDWRYIHSWFVFSTHLVNWCPMDEGTIYMVLVYCYPSTVPSLWHHPPPPFPMYSIYRLCDCGGGGGGGGVLKCTVDHILQEFYTLFLTRFRTYKIASPPQTKMTSKDVIKGLVSLKFLRPWEKSLFMKNILRDA